MQTCPRCGFVQPVDKYCANCGLDIEAYKPVPTPFLKRIFGNTTFIISVVIVAVICSTVYIYLSQKERIEKRLASAVPTLGKHITAPPVPPAATPASPAENEPAPLTQDPDSVAEDQKPVESPPPAAAATSTKTSETTSQNGHELTITFYEVSRAALQQLATEGTILSETPQSRSLSLTTTDPSAKIREHDSEAKMLGESMKETLVEGAPTTRDFTHVAFGQSGPSNIGITINLTPTHTNEANLDLALDLILNMRSETGNSLVTNEVNSTFSFSPKSTLVLSGFLPHQKVFKDDLTAFNGTPVAIFESAEFQNSVTDFVIIIQAK